MTNEDALTDLKSIFYHKHGLYTDDSFAFNMAFEALEKQIQKKPIHKEPEYVCPDCSIWLSFDDDVPETVSVSHPFCWHCGQALDWSEANG